MSTTAILSGSLSRRTAALDWTGTRMTPDQDHMHGWPTLVHFCQYCSYNTPVENSTSVWTQEHTCLHCGRSSAGAAISAGSEGTMNSTQHDELAQLFAQNMQLSYQTAQLPQQQQRQKEVMVDYLPTMNEKTQQPVAYASAHYTGTAHIRPDTTSEPSRSPPPPYQENEGLMPLAMAETLRQHSIDPASLLPNQVHLFANADYEQRLRLLELWRICPPAYPLEQHLDNKWQPTSVAQEEEEARIRFEARQSRQQRSMEEHMLDTYCISEPISPTREGHEPAWPLSVRMTAGWTATAKARSNTAEPYMTTGYQSAQSVDPVYAAAVGLWQAPSHARAMEQHVQPSLAMEEQYGRYEQIRNHADWERMNEGMQTAKGEMKDEMEL